MAHCGIHHPNSVDLVTQGEHGFQLVVVEEKTLCRNDSEMLQEKLNNYMDFAVGGNLIKHYPAAQDQAISIRIDLYAQPDPFIIEFIRRYRTAIADSNVQITMNINGLPIA